MSLEINLKVDYDMKKRFVNWERPHIEDGKPTKYNWVVQYLENFILGSMTDIGAFSYINAKYGVEIKDNVQIGSHCSIYSESTIDNKSGKITLEKNCRIGSHTTILPGVSIGENTVIGAHSLVISNIPDNVVAYGVPVRVMG